MNGNVLGFMIKTLQIEVKRFFLIVILVKFTQNFMFFSKNMKVRREGGHRALRVVGRTRTVSRGQPFNFDVSLDGPVWQIRSGKRAKWSYASAYIKGSQQKIEFILHGIGVQIRRFIFATPVDVFP